MKGALQSSLRQMLKTVIEMLDLVYKGYMKNDIHLLDDALKRTGKLEELEKDIIDTTVDLAGEIPRKGRKKLAVLCQIAEHIALMGDELRNLIERIELKITDKLYFSEKAVEQYGEVFARMGRSVDMIMKYLGDNKPGALARVIKNGSEIKKLIERYRKEHIERLTKGICEPRASNMYFDMLEFTGNIARHCTNIAKVSKGK